MTVSGVDSSMGDKTEKEKHKKHLQYDAKRLAAQHHKRETTEAQLHPISGHPATAERPASSGPIEVKAKVGVLAKVADIGCQAFAAILIPSLD
jgi:hypothetical protein